MAKYYNARVKTGRLAGSVFAIRNGETIERAYQPVVANPKTSAQVASRARLKLMSQMSAVMAPVIAIRREGAMSPRNLFVRENYGLTSYSNMQADIELPSVQLTKSVVAFPNPVFLRQADDNNSIAVSLSSAVLPDSMSRVVYCMFDKQADGKLRLFASAVATEAGNLNYWPADLPAMPDAGVLLAYGVRLNSENARTVFGNMEVETAETIAKLVVSRSLIESDVTMTETRGISIPAAQ